MAIVFAEITLPHHDEADFKAFERSAQQIAVVSECYLMASGFDYLLKLEAPTLARCQEALEKLQTMGLSVSSLAVLRQQRRR